MTETYTHSPDGTRIAYERHGAGPPLMLVHGGGGSCREWYESGYVDRLRGAHTVITPDLRGHGASDAPTDPAAYAIEALCQDLLTVADACGADRFALWGMSYGGKVGRYLALRPDWAARLTHLVMMGTPMGPGVSGERRQQALDFGAHWGPILADERGGTLALDALPPEDRAFMEQFNVPAMAGWVRAMLDWPAVEPADFLVPTLWLMGSQDTHAMTTLQVCENAIEESLVQVEVVEGLDHNTLFDKVEPALSIMLAFQVSGT